MSAGIYSIEKVNLYFSDDESTRRGGLEPQQRIGLNHPNVVATPRSYFTGSMNISIGQRIGRKTLIGDIQDVTFDSAFTQGKNVKNLQQFFKMNIPLIRSANCQYYKSQRLSGELDHSLEITRDISSGMNDLINRGEISSPYNDRNTIVFNNFVGATSVTGSHLVRYIQSGKYILGYPIVTDNLIDMDNYNDPDATDSFSGGFHRDGTIEPLGIRNGFYNPNTNFANILVEGIRGAFMPYTSEQGDLSDRKGSNILSDVVEFNQSNYDWFEDCQDLVFEENVLPIAGKRLLTVGQNPSENQNSAGDKFYSLEGYVSDGTYGISPFSDEEVDKKYFKGKYRQISAESTFSLLFSSSDDLSDIGSRFKSAHKGDIMTPKYDSVVQTVFGGTDSIAFSGLIRG